MSGNLKHKCLRLVRRQYKNAEGILVLNRIIGSVGLIMEEGSNAFKILTSRPRRRWNENIGMHIKINRNQ